MVLNFFGGGTLFFLPQISQCDLDTFAKYLAKDNLFEADASQPEPFKKEMLKRRGERKIDPYILVPTDPPSHPKSEKLKAEPSG